LIYAQVADAPRTVTMAVPGAFMTVFTKHASVSAPKKD
jgi:hypothetical protein